MEKILTDFNEKILMWNKILRFSDFYPEIQILITSVGTLLCWKLSTYQKEGLGTFACRLHVYDLCC